MAQKGRKSARGEAKDIGGTWAGKLTIEDNYGSGSLETRTYNAWLMIWPKSHMWWYQYFSSVSSFQVTAGGKYRMSGDTLWLGDNDSYNKNKVQLTNIVTRDASTIRQGHDSAGDPITLGTLIPGILDQRDTSQWKRYPKNDSLFWSTDSTRKSMGDFTKISAYKVSMSNGLMTLTRLDDVSYKSADPMTEVSLMVKSKKLVLRRATKPISWPMLPPGWM